MNYTFVLDILNAFRSLAEAAEGQRTVFDVCHSGVATGGAPAFHSPPPGSVLIALEQSASVQEVTVEVVEHDGLSVDSRIPNDVRILVPNLILAGTHLIYI